jgi:prevent-host-death family protein
MTISLTEDFKTVAELVNDPDGLLDQLKKTGRPINITRDGKPTAVILDVETFERLIQAINLAKFIGPAEEDVLAGRTKPLKEFIVRKCQKDIAYASPTRHNGTCEQFMTTWQKIIQEPRLSGSASLAARLDPLCNYRSATAARQLNWAGLSGKSSLVTFELCIGSITTR